MADAASAAVADAIEFAAVEQCAAEGEIIGRGRDQAAGERATDDEVADRGRLAV